MKLSNSSFLFVSLLLLFACGQKEQLNKGNDNSQKPKRQAQGIALSNITDSQVSLYWLNGDGQGRIICVSSDKSVAIPQSGKSYKAGRFGDNLCRMDSSNSYVVYNSTASQKDVGTTIGGLKPNTQYTIQVFEYNSVNGKIVFNDESANGNPRIVTTMLAAPSGLTAFNIGKGGFEVKWEKSAGIDYYEIDLSTDSAFTKFVDIYHSANIGDLGLYEFAELKSGTYYCRLCAVSKEQKSPYSSIIKLSIK